MIPFGSTAFLADLALEAEANNESSTAGNGCMGQSNVEMCQGQGSLLGVAHHELT